MRGTVQRVSAVASMASVFPETIQVDFDEGEGTTVIGEINTVTGEIRLKKADRWFDMQGRLLKGKPTVKGRYIHNGKVVYSK